MAVSESPKARCNRCLRFTWDALELNCNMPQPNGKICTGIFIMITEFPPHVYQRISEDVSNLLKVCVEPHEVEEILTAQTLGWPDGVVAAVQMEAKTYSIGVR